VFSLQRQEVQSRHFVIYLTPIGFRCKAVMFLSLWMVAMWGVQVYKL
jgi:hypothetical protein